LLIFTGQFTFIMTIQQCKYVIGIAKTGSFNEAANQLFIAQSSLSNSIKLLEQELNIKIFERSKNGVFLTSDGAEFLRYAEQLASRSDFIQNRYSSPDNAPERGRLYVTTQHYDFIADIFCRLLRETDGEYDLSLREIRTYEVIHEVETASSDIGIIAIKDCDFDIMNRFLHQKGIQFSQFLTALPHVYVRRGHLLSDKTRLSYEELKDFPYVSYDQGEHDSSFFTEEMSGSMQPVRHVKISDRATLMNVLLTTDCCTVGTGIMPSALNDEKIVGIPLCSDDYYRIGYILRNDRSRSNLMSRFISLLDSFGQNITD